jgi:hypothetical protein
MLFSLYYSNIEDFNMAGQVRDKDYSWNNNDQVIIKNTDLITGLIVDKDRAIAALSAISPISLSDITVDDYGTVIVTNAAFKRKIESLIPGGPGGLGTNNGCGNVLAVCVEEA